MSKLYGFFIHIIFEIPFLIASSIGTIFLIVYLTQFVFYPLVHQFTSQDQFVHQFGFFLSLPLSLVWALLLNKLNFFTLVIISKPSAAKYVITKKAFFTNFILLGILSSIFSIVASFTYI